MVSRKVFYNEPAYIVGLALLALGTAMMEKADFGMSMVVAPAYLLHLKLSQVFPFFSFGMAEYCFQAFLLILLGFVMRRFRLMYLLSFVTALIYGVLLDLSMRLAAVWPGTGLYARFVYYLLGMVVCAFGIAMLFDTYIAPEAYELFVKEIAGKTGKQISLVKTAYDCISCLAGIIMSFAFFGIGHFEGVKAGTIFCALINGGLIGICSKVLQRCFVFKDGLPWLKKIYE